ncbi:PKD domain-containing protein, partial [Dehalococcoidia bacterium]|nr:PKD domain-containing protein [Dehalococcoidia bacterium]
APEQPPIPIPPEPPSAIVVGHRVLPRDVAVGEEVTIGFTFTNTGNVAHTFGAGATLRSPDGRRIDFLKPVTVNPGEEGSAQWTHTIDVAGRWDVVFGVWEESTHPLENLIVETGWVDEYITAIENQPPVAIIEPVTDRILSGEGLLFNALDSYDPDGTIVSYRWDFGDGTTAKGRAAVHRFRGAQNEPKTYTISLTVEDDRGGTATETVLVTVDPIQKTLEITGDHVIPIPFLPIPIPFLPEFYMRVTVTYNWVDTIGGDDIYIISEIAAESEGIVGQLQILIMEEVHWVIPAIMWADVLMTPIQDMWGHPVTRLYTPADHFATNPFLGTNVPMTLLTFPEGAAYPVEVFEGIKVEWHDMIMIWGVGTALTPPLVVDIQGRAFDPDAEVVSGSPELRFLLDLVIGQLKSPGELRVYDSEGRVTGLVDGETKQEIPYSLFDEDNNAVIIFFPTDTYYFEVAGTEEATYGLTIMSVEEGEAEALAITDVPTTETTIHQFEIDREALVQAGVTMKTDADGDGVFEKQRTLQPPVASFAYSPEEMIAGQPITFDASGSSDPDGEIMSYEWDFGDGTSGTGKVVEHTFALAGDYTVTLTIADNDGVVSSFSKKVTVAETAVDLPAPAVDPPDPAVDPPDPAVDPPVPAVDPPARLNWGIIGGIAVAVVVVGLGILFLVKRRRVAQQE